VFTFDGLAKGDVVFVHLRNIAERHNGFHYFYRHLRATWWGVGNASILLATYQGKEVEVR